MKKTFTLIAYSILFSSVYGQNIQKHLVVFEKFTGIYCGACPTAVENIHDLIENENAQVATISYHSSGSYSIPLYENSDSDGRHSYYAGSISGYPTVITEGNMNPVWNDYTDYLNKYNTAYNTTTPLDIVLNTVDNGNGNISLAIDVEKVNGATAPSNPLKLRIAITETNVDQLWMSETKLYDINRKMLPDHNGTEVSFTSGDIQNYSESFTIDESWDRDYLSVIAFVQDETTKEVLQAVKVSIADLTSDNDAMVDYIYGEDEYCGTALAPKIRIRNSGNTTLTSATISYSVGTSTGSYDWTGSLESLEQEDVNLPALNFTASDGIYIMASTSQPNGGTDADISNDENSKLVVHGLVIGSTSKLEIQTDNFAPFYTEWKLYDASETVIESAGKSDWTSFTNYEYPFTLTTGCYRLSITDDTGNGFYDYTILGGYANEGSPEGYYRFFDDQNTIIAENVEFGFEDNVFFGVGIDVVSGVFDVTGQVAGVDEIVSVGQIIGYPNPMNNEVTFELTKDGKYMVNIYNGQGQKVLNTSITKQNATINVSELTAGIYFVDIYNDTNRFKLKISKQ